MRSTWLGFALVCAGVAGCGDGGGLPPPGPAKDMAVAGSDDMPAPGMDMTAGVPDMQPSVTFDKFAMDYANTVCAHLLTCGRMDAAQMAACVERNLRHTGWDQNVEIMKGRVEIKEAECLDAIAKSRCDDSDSGAWGARCRQLLYVPHQANGSGCLSFVECTSGYCQHGGSDAGVTEEPTGCNGTCAPPKATGAPCRLAQDCGPDSYCASNLCTKRAALGEACASVPCQIGLLCPSFPGASPATCVTPAMQSNAGGACDPLQGAVTTTPSCAAGMYCQVQYTGSTPTGGVCRMKVAISSPCDPKNEGPFSFVQNQCADGSRCYKTAAQATESCQPYGAVNADCQSFTANLDSCKVGLFCSAGKCTPWFGDGQACDVSNHCPSSTVQNVCIADNPDAGTNKTCQATMNVGKPCLPGFEDTLCAPADNANTSYCAASSSGGTGFCAPKCF